MSTFIAFAPVLMGLFACSQLVVAGVLGLCLVKTEDGLAGQ